MDNRNIIFFDDDKDFSRLFKTLMKDTDFKINAFSDFEELKKALNNSELMAKTKVFILDLAKDKTEEGQAGNFSIIKNIEDKYNNYRIPIFIHSAFANEVRHFENRGTVWKIEKSGNSLEKIAEIILNLEKSNFLDIFCPHGIIEISIMQELHKSFTDQFRHGEIEKIIESIRCDDSNEFKKRSTKVFKRIAVRSLLSELLSKVDPIVKTKV